MPRLRRLAILLTAALATVGLSACGNHPDKHASIVRAETEGIYLDIGPLKYQVQVSRQMNPYNIQDKALLVGVPKAQRNLAPNQTWFAIFMRVENETKQNEVPASNIEIADTQHQIYRPIALGPDNVFAYRSSEAVPPGQVAPLEGSPAFELPARGLLLLFKLTNQTLDNRPLELKIVSPVPPQQTGIIDLDV